MPSNIKDKNVIKQNNNPKILFLCTGNSCRSQMAEAWLRKLKGNNFEVTSAGIEKHGMNPFAIEVMKEVGVDLSKQYSKLLAEVDTESIDVVISVCSHADQTCPIFPGRAKKIFKGFEDPPKLAQGLVEKEEILDCYRKVRDQIKQFVLDFEENIIL
jgi:arsenate reductase